MRKNFTSMFSVVSFIPDIVKDIFLLVAVLLLLPCMSCSDGADNDDSQVQPKHYHPKGIYAAQILSLDQGQCVSVVTEAPSSASLSPWPLTGDTIVFSSQMDSAFEPGETARFSIEECWPSLPDHLSHFRRNYAWTARVGHSSDEADDGSERYGAEVMGTGELVTFFPEGEYVLLKIDDIRSVVIEAPQLSKIFIWPTVNDTVAISNASALANTGDRVVVEMNSSSLFRQDVIRRRLTSWFAAVTVVGE